MLSGCAKYTDFKPKGQNLLETAVQIDMLMNVDYMSVAFGSTNQTVLINDRYPLFAMNAINAATPSMDKILLTYDEGANRAALAQTDGAFEGFYKLITTMNIALMQADIASGDPQLLNQIRAEALIMRAFFHYRVVNIYAKAYDPAAAASDGGIGYVTEVNFEKEHQKKTVKEVYDNILSDINAAFALNALPDQPKNNMRVGKGFAYGLKAQVMLSTRDYAGSLEAVNSALTLNSTLEDHRPLLALPRASRTPAREGRAVPENLFYAGVNRTDPSGMVPSLEAFNNLYEPGNIIKDSTNTYNMIFGPAATGVPGTAYYFHGGYQGNLAGMTTADLVLIKAECLIRTGKINDGMAEINKIRIRRIAPFTLLTATNEAQAMAHLQRTSRIEFLFTIRNFINIKRWNREGKYPITLERTLNGVTYTLQPNSPLYVFPFPQSVTQFNPNITQNY